MKLIVLFALVAAAWQAQAGPALRVPVIFTDDQGSYTVSQVKALLADAGLKVPSYLIIRNSKSVEALSEIAASVDEAEIKLANSKENLHVEMYGRLSSYAVKGNAFPLCYLPEPAMSLKQSALRAVKLVRNLGDGLLSDQYSIQGVRYWTEKSFDPDLVEGADVDYLNENYASDPLPKGAVQIINTVGDEGTDDKADVLSPCKTAK